jgi:hypothetical protein
MSWSLLLFLAGIALIASWGAFEIFYYARTKRAQHTALRRMQRAALMREQATAAFMPQRQKRGASMQRQGGSMLYDDEATHIAVPDAFDERRIQHDLMQLAEYPTLFGQYVAQAKKRFTHKQQIKLLTSWTSFYQSATTMVKSRNELANSLMETGNLRETKIIKDQENQVTISRLEADQAEQHLRAAEARHKTEILKNPAPIVTETPPRQKTKAELRREKEEEIADLKAYQKKREQIMREEGYSEEEVRYEMNKLDDMMRRKQEELYSKYF